MTILHTTKASANRKLLVRRIGVGIVVLIILFITSPQWLPSIGRWLTMSTNTDLRQADAIVIHGGNPYRTDYGVALYRRGLAPELWHTSYANRYDLTELIVVNNDGVPQRAFHYLATTSTWSDGTEIAAAIRAQKLHSVIIVTDWWHSRRALCATEQQLGGYNVAIQFAPSASPAGPDTWWKNPDIRKDVLSELVKLGYYAARYGMNPWGC